MSKIGDEISCVCCGKKIIKDFPAKKYCKSCGRKVSYQQKIEARKERYKESEVIGTKKCEFCGEYFDIKEHNKMKIMCSRECRRKMTIVKNEINKLKYEPITWTTSIPFVSKYSKLDDHEKELVNTMIIRMKESLNHKSIKVDIDDKNIDILRVSPNSKKYDITIVLERGGSNKLILKDIE